MSRLRQDASADRFVNGMFRKFGIGRGSLLARNDIAWRRRGPELDRKRAIEIRLAMANLRCSLIAAT
jgi:hypothetical protein